MSNEATTSDGASPIEEKLQLIEVEAAEVKADAEEKTASVKGLLIDLRGTQVQQVKQSNGIVTQNDTMKTLLQRQLDMLHREMEQTARDNAPAGRRFKEFEKTGGEFDYSKPVFEWSAADVAVGVVSTILTVGIVVAAGYAGGRAARPGNGSDITPVDDDGEF